MSDENQTENKASKHDVALTIACMTTVGRFLEAKGAPVALAGAVEELAQAMAQEYGIESVTGNGPGSHSVTVNFTDGSGVEITGQEIHDGGARFLAAVVMPMAQVMGWDGQPQAQKATGASDTWN